MKRTQEEFEKELELTLSQTPWGKRKDVSRKEHLKWWNELEVGDKAHIQGYVDIDPCTVIFKSDTQIIVRLDHAINRSKSNLDTSNAQNWSIYEDKHGALKEFYLHIGDDFGFMNRQGEKLLPGWNKYYDFNF